MTGRRHFATIARWGACFILVLGAHAAGAMALFDWHVDVAPIASGPVILMDLAPAPAAPSVKKSALPPGPQRPQAQATPAPTPKPDKPIKKAELTSAPDKPIEKSDLKPAPKPVLKPEPVPAPEKPLVEKVPVPPAPTSDEVLTMLPPPRPHIVPHKREDKPHHEQARRARPHRLASLASAPSAAERQAAHSAAPAPGAAQRDVHAVSNWRSQLLAQLERSKRYPDDAERRGEHGVAQLAFDVDRHGGVHHVRILRSSGSARLDRATLALAHRAAPLPPPPSALSGARIPVVVPIRYKLR